DSRIRTYNRCPIFRVRDALHYTDSMIIKTLRVRGRSEWREFLNDLPRAKFIFSSEALDRLKLRMRPGPGVELRLVGGKELVLYNPHRCFLQLGQPRHTIPALSHYTPIEPRIFGTYQDQVNVRSCLATWEIGALHQSKLMIDEECELVAA